MKTPSSQRPEPDEYAPYFARYITLVPEGEVLQILESQIETTLSLLANVPEDRADYRYAAGKWSMKEVVGHLADTERILSYRALRIARGDRTPLPGFDENAYVVQADFAEHTLGDLATEFRAVRQATLLFFRHLSADAWARRGVANQVEVSVRALAYVIAGHELHHRGILESRYLTPDP